MGAALWFRATLAVFFLWIVLTIWVIWQLTGAYFPALNHGYFFRWVLCGILTDTPLLSPLATWLPMYAAGNWYTLPSFGAWLNSQYGASFYAWYWYATIGFYGFGTDLFPFAVAASFLVWRWRRDPEGIEHLRGLRLFTPRQLGRELYGSWLKRAYRGAPSTPGITLGTSVIPAEKEAEHFLITGSPGAGKSTLIRQMLMQIQDRGQPAVVLDVEGEFVQQFYNESRGDYILNSVDMRCPWWSPYAEFRDETLPMDLEAMAASLVRTPPRDAAQEFFFKTGRKLLKCLFAVLDDYEPHAIFEFLSQPLEDIQEQLKDTVAYRLVDPGLKETGHNIIGTALTAVGPFEHLPHSNESNRKFSCREWAQKPNGWIFLTSTASTQATTQPMQAIWLDLLVSRLMDADISNDPKNQVWVLADELASLDYQPNILTLATRARKRNRVLVMGFQNIAQVRSIYGTDAAITLTSAPTTKIILRCDEPQTANWASSVIGSREVERLTLTQLAGLSTYREGANLSPHRGIEPLVLADEIKMLQPFTGYLCIAGAAGRTTIKIPELHLVRHHPAFIARPPAATPPPKTNDANVPPIDEPTDEEIIAQLAARR
jgi:type IV secretory pathway TraG/TraD family ATPase VirD4